MKNFTVKKVQGEYKTEYFNQSSGFSLERVRLKGNGPKWESQVIANGVSQEGIFSNFLTPCELSININHRKEKSLCPLVKRVHGASSREFQGA